MFCHANGIWRLDVSRIDSRITIALSHVLHEHLANFRSFYLLQETDVFLIERPTAPGGATGGGTLSFSFRFLESRATSQSLTYFPCPPFTVEYEAVNYLVCLSSTYRAMLIVIQNLERQR
jgi:hypothetical protein